MMGRWMMDDVLQLLLVIFRLTALTLPYLPGGQVVTPAQRWGRISSAQCTTTM